MNEKGMTVIVKTVTRYISGLIFLFGLYILLFGHLTPGGGFAGGVIMAGCFILITLSFGKEEIEKFLKHKKVTFLESLGALIFLIMSFLPVIFGKDYFLNIIHQKFGSIYFKFLSSGNIIIYNIGIAIKVMAGIFFVFFILSITRVVVFKGDYKIVKRK
ncbi:MAG: hypothetical protein DRI36_00575 [Caldiserica bacterium]|nr:MAG: hypothetical protein DRI36_00575 [Caldisericota bacterium]